MQRLLFRKSTLALLLLFINAALPVGSKHSCSGYTCPTSGRGIGGNRAYTPPAPSWQQNFCHDRCKNASGDGKDGMLCRERCASKLNSARAIQGLGVDAEEFCREHGGVKRSRIPTLDSIRRAAPAWLLPEGL